MTDKFRPLKDAFGRFATGIAVVTCRTPDGVVAALTVNSFTSVSLEPPLVLWCLENTATVLPSFEVAENYAVSVLRHDQRALSDRFAGYRPSPPGADESEVIKTGAPLLKNRIAGFDCDMVARHRAGDHVILVGRVLHFDCTDEPPLVYHASRYLRGLGEKL